MKTLTMVIGNGYSGCTKEVDMDYTKDEWSAMSEKEQAEIEVQSKFPNESRHETALRYIRSAESRDELAQINVGDV